MRKKTMAITALMLAGVLLVSLSACGAKDEGKNGQKAQGGGLFEEMEAFDLEGNELDRTVFEENKLTVVNVWNLGCTPCIQEIPELQKINQEYEDKGVSVMGLYYNFGDELTDDVKKEITELLDKAGAVYPHIVPSQKMYESKELSKLQVFPTTYFVDSSGRIVKVTEGATDFDGWKSMIDDVLKEVSADE